MYGNIVIFFNYDLLILFFILSFFMVYVYRFINGIYLKDFFLWVIILGFDFMSYDLVFVVFLVLCVKMKVVFLNIFFCCKR